MPNIKYKVLLVDDDAFLLDMYALKFKEEDFSVEISSGAADALDKICGGAIYDIILLDIIMPTMDGFDFLDSVKKEKLIPETKIIVLSNLGQSEDIDRALALGATDYVVKAYFTPTEIVKKVKTLLKIKN